MEKIKYVTYENEHCEEYSILEMLILYHETVDKNEYLDFDIWLMDMLRSGVFVKVTEYL